MTFDVSNFGLLKFHSDSLMWKVRNTKDSLIWKVSVKRWFSKSPIAHYCNYSKPSISYEFDHLVTVSLTSCTSTISPCVLFIFFNWHTKYQNLDFAVHLSFAKIFIWYSGGTLFFSVGTDRPITLYCFSWKKVQHMFTKYQRIPILYRDFENDNFSVNQELNQTIFNRLLTIKDCQMISYPLQFFAISKWCMLV